MSSSTWTPAELSSSRAPLDVEVWRIVEAQHRVSTMKLVDSLAEQKLLEDIIERSKPAVPEECRHLHYLLFTPFRYPSPKGSRFRWPGAGEGVFYSACCPETAVAEASFYRLLFFAESPGLPFPKNPSEYTAFSVPLLATAPVDLRLPPFDAREEVWTRLNDYGPCQDFAAAAREAGIEAICYSSVRDPERRPCYAVLRCSAFAAAEPAHRQTWQLLASASGVYAYCEYPKYGITYPIGTFARDSRLSPLLAA